MEGCAYNLANSITATEAYKNRKPREGYTFQDPHATKEQVEARIEAILKQYPHLSIQQATRLDILRCCKELAMRYQNSNGGGRYPAYCHEIGVPF